MGDADANWSKIGQPATKADVIFTLFRLRRVVLHTSAALSALRQNQVGLVDELLRELDKDDAAMSELIDKLGGNTVRESK